MKSMSKSLTVNSLSPVLLLALSLVVSCALARAQSDQNTGTGQLSSHPLQSANGRIDPTATMDDDDPATRQRQLIMFYAALNRSMVSDTNKLLKLVTELNAELSSTNPDALTPAQLKKVAAIEKLAHNVKDAMKTSVQGTPTLKDALKEPPRHVKPSL
jgi:hypothetical protein